MLRLPTHPLAQKGKRNTNWPQTGKKMTEVNRINKKKTNTKSFLKSKSLELIVRPGGLRKEENFIMDIRNK